MPAANALVRIQAMVKTTFHHNFDNPHVQDTLRDKTVLRQTMQDAWRRGSMEQMQAAQANIWYQVHWHVQITTGGRQKQTSLCVISQQTFWMTTNFGQTTLFYWKENFGSISYWAFQLKKINSDFKWLLIKLLYILRGRFSSSRNYSNIWILGQSFSFQLPLKCQEVRAVFNK